MPEAFLRLQMQSWGQGAVGPASVSASPPCVHIFLLIKIKISWLQVECRQRNDNHWHIVNRLVGERGPGSSALVCYTAAPLEAYHRTKLNTHLARITSCPSKIFHYHNIKNVRGAPWLLKPCKTGCLCLVHRVSVVSLWGLHVTVAFFFSATALSEVWFMPSLTFCSTFTW